jgi:protein tyrosine phosphatase (PTP) superfamily phosphohydrolase (DUF442 family)
MIRILGTLALLALGFSQARAGPDQLASIINYREYSPTFSSSGQPSSGQLRAVREAGFGRVVFLAYSDHHDSLDGEDRLVRDLGMEYIQIPVEWEAPEPGDFRHFAAVMQARPERKTLVHCQVNFRASAFSFLYRVLYEEVPMDQAFDDLNGIWVPNATWRELIFRVLEEHGRSPDCDSCLWGNQ